MTTNNETTKTHSDTWASTRAEGAQIARTFVGKANAAAGVAFKQRHELPAAMCAAFISITDEDVRAKTEKELKAGFVAEAIAISTKNIPPQYLHMSKDEIAKAAKRDAGKRWSDAKRLITDVKADDLAHGKGKRNEWTADMFRTFDLAQQAAKRAKQVEAAKAMHEAKLAKEEAETRAEVIVEAATGRTADGKALREAYEHAANVVDRLSAFADLAKSPEASACIKAAEQAMESLSMLMFGAAG